MKLVIWKFLVPFGDNAPVDMPAGAEIIRVHRQGEQVFLWAICNPDNQFETRRFTIRSTGLDIFTPETQGLYLGSTTIGHYEWHVFESVSLKEESNGEAS